ncbi:Nramp family divalent metal transporter [Sphingomonas sp. OTU376]|uniref:Nramp family divalent metal transporter n=1 Tax=Sphingomonas sp. OTU376 TaxID=3043863 RepID=UPI00313DDE59
MTTTALGGQCRPPVRTADTGGDVPAGNRLRRPWSLLMGPGLLVAVGYMDPGNWATDIEAGARLGYGLLFVVLLAGGAAMLLQSLAMRLGVASGRDLAQLSRDHFGPRLGATFGVLAIAAIVATNVAEVLGAALGFKLLFGFPLAIGVALTALAAFLILNLKGRGMTGISAIVIMLVAVITICLVLELVLARPDPASVARGLLPSRDLLADPFAAYLAIGILGATVMPHNLYLHSTLVAGTPASRRQRIRSGTLDTIVSLGLATFLNLAILAVAASIFHARGEVGAGIEEAHRLLTPLAGSGIAGGLFAVALLAAGHSSTLTGAMAGQAIFDGFFRHNPPAWQQWLFTRVLAILLALTGVLLLGDGSASTLLVLSQVILSFQLPFAVFPLIRFAASERYMGRHAITAPTRLAAWAVFAIICLANLYLVASAVAGATGLR